MCVHFAYLTLADKIRTNIVNRVKMENFDAVYINLSVNASNNASSMLGLSVSLHQNKPPMFVFANDSLKLYLGSA